ncbi:hypothetical protein CRYUN_Cryun25bG0074500 [Craigia yunnanensis]
MAAIDEDIDKTLSQINQILSQTDQCFEQLLQESDAKGVKMLQIVKDATQELIESQQDTKRELYEWLTPFYQSGDGDIRNLDLSQLQEEVIRVIRTKGKDELVGLVEGLERLKKRGDEINERVFKLMMDFNIVPKCREVKKFTPSHLSSPGKEVGKEKSDQGLKKKESGVLSVAGVAIEMYGFPWDISLHIEASLGLRKLIQNESLFNMDEALIIRLDEDSDEDVDPFLQKTAREQNWVRVKKLKRKFEELENKIYKKQELHQNAAPKEGNGNEDPESLRVSFLRVIRNWIFHIEAVLFDLVYELYYMLSGNQTAEAIFQCYRAKLEKLMKINHGMVPITVYKIIDMMEKPREFKAKGVVFRTPTKFGSGSRKLHKELNDVIDHVHKIILRLRAVLSSSGLSSAKRIIAGKSTSYENMLKQSEEEVRHIEGKVNSAKSEFGTNPIASLNELEKEPRKRKSDSLEEEHRTRSQRKEGNKGRNEVELAGNPMSER